MESCFSDFHIRNTDIGSEMSGCLSGLHVRIHSFLVLLDSFFFGSISLILRVICYSFYQSSSKPKQLHLFIDPRAECVGMAGYTNYCDRQLQFGRGLGIAYPFLLFTPPRGSMNCTVAHMSGSDEAE